MTKQEKNMLLESFARGRESYLVESYLTDGPAVLREKLGVESEDQWRVIFDYLVFQHGLLFKAVSRNSEFFVDNYVKHGLAHVREMLVVEDEKYDLAFEVVFDFLAISKEGLRFHVLHFRERYTEVFYKHGAEFLRKVLYIWNEKYEESWAEVLELLLNGVCEGMFNERNMDNSLKAFSYLMNGKRVARKL